MTAAQTPGPAGGEQPSTPARTTRLQTAVGIAITVVACLALLDAAFETVRAELPGCWWLAGCAVACVLAVGWISSRPRLSARVSWMARGTSSLFVFLALLAAPAWLRLGGSITMFRQSASVWMSLATAAGVLVGTLTLVRARVLPVVARWVAAAVGTYGVVAFLLAVRAGTSYELLFRGQAAWTRLPVVLQGTILGTFAIVPLALLVEAVQALRRVGNRWRPQQVLALAMSFVMALSPLPGAGSVAKVTTGSAPPAAAGGSGDTTLRVPSPGETPVSVAPGLPQRAPYDPQTAARQTSALVKDLDPARFQIDARAKLLAPGVDEAFALVRDQIRFEAYPGVFRGASGAYLSRAANAADRSLLLVALLNAKNVRTRFAFGQLSRDDAKRLFEHMFDAPRKPTPRGAPAPGTPPPEQSPLLARIQARARHDYAVLRAALGSRLRPVTRPSRDQVLDEIVRHVWVQAEVAGSWVDLDSAFADATPGKTFCRTERTADALPEQWHQHVTLRVLVETLNGNALAREDVLKKTYRTADLLAAPVFLLHVPVSGGSGLLGGGGASGQWTPVLWIDGRQDGGRTFAFGEEKADIGGILGGGGEGGRTFVAEWLEIDVALPDGRHDVTRRALVDRASAAWRKSGALSAETLRPLPENERGVKAAQAAHNILFSAGGQDLAAYAQSLDWMAQALASGDVPSQETPAAAQLAIAALQNRGWLLLTDHMVVPSLNDSPADRLYPDSPRVTIVSTGLDPFVEGASGFIQGDLRRDHLRGVSRTDDGQGIAERKLWFAALEGALEHEVAAEQAVAAYGESAAVTSTSALLGDGGVTVLAQAGDAGRVSGNAELAARVGDVLAGGATVVVPNRLLAGTTAAWWEIAPETGDARSVLEAYSAETGGAYGRGGSPSPYNYTNAKNAAVWCHKGGLVIVRCDPNRGGGNEYVTVVKENSLSVIGWVTLNAEIIQWAIAVVSAAITIALPVMSYIRIRE